MVSRIIQVPCHAKIPQRNAFLFIDLVHGLWARTQVRSGRRGNFFVNSYVSDKSFDSEACGFFWTVFSCLGKVSDNRSFPFGRRRFVKARLPCTSGVFNTLGLRYNRGGQYWAAQIAYMRSRDGYHFLFHSFLHPGHGA